MNKWLDLSLQLAVLVGTFLIIYFFPAKDPVDDFAKGFIGFVIMWVLEELKEE